MLRESRRFSLQSQSQFGTRITVITPQIGIQTRSLGLPLRQALQTAAELGADGVEIDVRNELRIADFSGTALRQFRKLLKDYRLSVAAVSFPTRRGLQDTTDLEQRILAIGEAMRFAYQIGAKVVLHRSDRLPKIEIEGEENSDRIHWIDSATLLAHRSNHFGPRLAIVSGEAPSHQAALLEQVPEAIGVGIHPVQLLREGNSPTEAAQLLASRAIYLHAVDAVRDFGSDQSVSEVELGRGSADMPAMLSHLEERGYEGWVTVERHASNDIKQEMDNAIAYLRSL